MPEQLDFLTQLVEPVPSEKPESVKKKPHNLSATIDEVNAQLEEFGWRVLSVEKANQKWLPVFIDSKDRVLYLDLNDFKDKNQLVQTIALALQVERVKNNAVALINASHALKIPDEIIEQIDDFAITREAQHQWPYVAYSAKEISGLIQKIQERLNISDGKAFKDVGYIPGNRKERFAFSQQSFVRSAKDILQTDKDVKQTEFIKRPKYSAIIAKTKLEDQPLFDCKLALRYLEFLRESISNKLAVSSLPQDTKAETVNNYMTINSVLADLITEVITQAHKGLDTKLPPLIDKTRQLLQITEDNTGAISLPETVEKCLTFNGQPISKAFANEQSRFLMVANLVYDVEHANWPLAIPHWHQTYRIQQVADDGFAILRRGDHTRVEKAVYSSREEAEDKAKHLYLLNQFKVKHDTDEGVGFAIYRVFQGNQSARRVQTGFATETDAKQYLRQNTEELFRRHQDRIVRPTSDRPRVGPKHRARDVQSTDEFVETFDLDRVVFGNQMTEGDRVASLNAAHDAFCDLADVLGIDKKAVGLNGSLSLSFGARGKPGPNAPMAHYEPDETTINLTKNNGAGCLAHEWFHALDHYSTGFVNYASELAPSNLDELESGINGLYKHLSQNTINTRDSALHHHIQASLNNVVSLLAQTERGFNNIRTYEGHAKYPDNWEALKELTDKALNAPHHEALNLLMDIRNVYSDAINEAFSGAIEPHKPYGEKLKNYFSVIEQNTLNEYLFLEAQPESSFDRLVDSRIMTVSRGADAIEGKEYWSTPRELFARASEAMVQYALYKKGNCNDYLVCCPKTGLYPTKMELNNLLPHFKSMSQALSVRVNPSMVLEAEPQEVKSNPEQKPLISPAP